MAEGPRKRSLTLAGHRTSISLEPEFWDALQAICRADGRTLTSLVREIDEVRGARNLSSALRVFILARAVEGRLERAPVAEPTS
ncbi:MAG: ribbon-helix-helix domain-containing protein [Parvibaculaceae bacterium]